MSAASRLAKADTRIERPRDRDGKFVKVEAVGWQLARNAMNVPGGVSTVPLSAPIVVLGIRWLPEDAGPHSSSIGYALALEMRS